MVQYLLRSAKSVTLKKGECAVEAGETQSQLSFLVSGILRGFIIDESGLDISDCFMFQCGDAVTGCNGLGRPSLISIEALTDCELIQIPISVLNELLDRHPEVLQAYNKLLQESLDRHWAMKRTLYQPAMQRYQWFLATYPGLIDNISNKYVASFLGITPVTLSRLRRRLRESKQ